MNCKQVNELLTAYGDNEISPSERALVEAHLAGCAPCQRKVNDLAATRSRLKQSLKLMAAQAAPSPQAWSEIQEQIAKSARPLPKKTGPWPTQLAPEGKAVRPIKHYGDNKMRKMIWSAFATIVTLAIVTVFLVNNVMPVSAQQILERATAVQSATIPAQGIWHFQFEEYVNPTALEGDQVGTKTLTDDYNDNATGYNRRVTRDSNGKLLDVSSYDGSYEYSSYPPSPAVKSSSGDKLTIYRTPQKDDPRTKGGNVDVSSAGRPTDRAAMAKALFDDFHANPRVELEGKVNEPNGREAYVLVDKNYQTQKLLNGEDTKTFSGTMKMVFDTQTYELVETQITVRKNSKDIIINSVKYLVDELMPAGSKVAWNLDDLQGISIVDSPKTEATADKEPKFGTLTQKQLLTFVPNTYMLKNTPEGYTLEIDAVENQPKDQEYRYENNYYYQGKVVFGLMYVGEMEPGFIEKSFYDGSYKAASGLVLHYSVSGKESNSGKSSTGGMLTVPEGYNFLLSSTLPRDKVQALVDDLVLVK